MDASTDTTSWLPARPDGHLIEVGRKTRFRPLLPRTTPPGPPGKRSRRVAPDRGRGASVSATLVGLIAGFNLILGHVLERDARDLVRARAVAAIDSLRVSDGRGALAVWCLAPAGVRMTRQAAEWSERDLDHRFALGPPHDELTELAATLDGLLDRLAAGLRHERRFSAELSHELRTPLASVLAESELALRRRRARNEYEDALELIHRNAEHIARTIDVLVAAARYEAGGERGTADAHAVAAEAARACNGLATDRKLELEVVRPPRALRVGVDADLAERIILPVLENACHYGAARIRVRIGSENSSVVYEVEDDGPGVGAGERERIFEPGVRGAAAQHVGQGAGLGLALARRLARTIDGDVLVDSSAVGGRFLIKLPAA